MATLSTTVNEEEFANEAPQKKKKKQGTICRVCAVVDCGKRHSNKKLSDTTKISRRRRRRKFGNETPAEREIRLNNWKQLCEQQRQKREAILRKKLEHRQRLELEKQKQEDKREEERWRRRERKMQVMTRLPARNPFNPEVVIMESNTVARVKFTDGIYGICGGSCENEIDGEDRSFREALERVCARADKTIAEGVDMCTPMMVKQEPPDDIHSELSNKMSTSLEADSLAFGSIIGQLASLVPNEHKATCMKTVTDVLYSFMASRVPVIVDSPSTNDT